MARILVVDDDVNVLKYAELVLGGKGHDIVGFTSAESAFQSCRKYTFDLIVLDLIMPGFSGIDFLAALKILQNFRTPILMLSGQGERELLLKSIEWGASDYVVKPFDPQNLIERVEFLIKKYATATKPL